MAVSLNNNQPVWQ